MTMMVASIIWIPLAGAAVIMVVALLVQARRRRVS
jgi:LPXTG-motif cell wall-anchored protein